ncbi:MAG TPA: VanW family protein [Candidatus Limnocylindrales bacterium]|nr:VanW family protein [Candidatus Limnocylindrales bacterium]
MAILPIKKQSTKKLSSSYSKEKVSRFIRVSMWFFLGVFLGFFFFVSFLYFTYRTNYKNSIYEGVIVNNMDFGGKSKNDLKIYFAKKNREIAKTLFVLNSAEISATISAAQINFGYDEDLIGEQAFLIGRSGSILTDMSIILQAYVGGVHLPPATHYKEDKLNRLILPVSKKIDEAPTEGLFNFENGRVSAFKLSKNGKKADTKQLKEVIIEKMEEVAIKEKPKTYTIKIPIKILEPKVSTDKINNYGIKELVAEGTSLFRGSIENRAFNINLAATRLNGTLIPPGETFSFVKSVGEINSLSGYKQAYVISGGKTILGDGGGVCQVSTTLFRAALKAGLPIVERNQHAYRVGYYEQDTAPGVDAAIYSPGVDLKFKNDTGKHLLIQAFPDMNDYSLSFQLYGTKDNREVIINEPVILSQSPAPEPEYQDDPNLPKGQVKQIDFAAGGANVYFTRTVKKDGKTIADDKFVSNYRPWKAVYLRGTKE